MQNLLSQHHESSFGEGDWVQVSEDAPVKMAKKGWTNGLRETVGRIGIFVEELPTPDRFCVIDFSMTPGIEHFGRRVLLASCLFASNPQGDISFDEGNRIPAEPSRKAVEPASQSVFRIEDEFVKLEKQLKELFAMAADAERTHILGEDGGSNIFKEIAELQDKLVRLRSCWSEADMLDNVEKEQRVGFPLRLAEDERIIDPLGEQQAKIKQIASAIAAKSLRKQRENQRQEGLEQVMQQQEQQQKQQQLQSAAPSQNDKPENKMVDFIKQGTQSSSFKDVMREVGTEIYNKYRSNRREKMSDGGDKEEIQKKDVEEEVEEDNAIMSFLRSIPGLQDGSFDTPRRQESKVAGKKKRWKPSTPSMWNFHRLPPNVYSGEVSSGCDYAIIKRPLYALSVDPAKCPAAAEEALYTGIHKYTNRKSKEDVYDHLWKLKGEQLREIHERTGKEMLAKLSRNTKTYPPGTRWIVNGRPLVKQRYNEEQEKWIEFVGEEEEVAFSISWDGKTFIFPPGTLHGYLVEANGTTTCSTKEDPFANLTLESLRRDAEEMERFLNETENSSTRSTALHLLDKCTVCLNFLDKELTIARANNDLIFMELEAEMRRMSKLHVKLNFVYGTASQPSLSEADVKRIAEEDEDVLYWDTSRML